MNRQSRKPVETSRQDFIIKLLCMKKFIFGVLTLVLLVSITAFSFGHKSSIKPPDPELYWYEVVGTAIDHTKPVNSEQAITKSDLLSQPSLLPCIVGDGPDCVRGFEQQQTTDVSSGEMDVIQKEN